MLSDRLKELVALSGKKQLEIAKDLNFTQQRFNFYVSGRREPDNVTLTQIAQYFGVTTDYLLSVDNSTNKNTHLSETDRCVLELFKEYPVMYKLVEAIRGMDAERQQDLIDFAQLHAYKYGQKEQK